MNKTSFNYIAKFLFKYFTKRIQQSSISQFSNECLTIASTTASIPIFKCILITTVRGGFLSLFAFLIYIYVRVASIINIGARSIICSTSCRQLLTETIGCKLYVVKFLALHYFDDTLT